jgi:hypothetical protein
LHPHTQLSHAKRKQRQTILYTHTQTKNHKFIVTNHYEIVRMAPTNTQALDNTFSSACALCAQHSENILSGRGYINTFDPNSLTPAQAGAMVWSQIVENEGEQLHFWETAAAEIRFALVSGGISLAALAAAKGLPTRAAEYEQWATKTAEALIAVTRAGFLASARAEVDEELRRKAEMDQFEVAELKEAARCEAPCEVLAGVPNRSEAPGDGGLGWTGAFYWEAEFSSVIVGRLW